MRTSPGSATSPKNILGSAAAALFSIAVTFLLLRTSTTHPESTPLGDFRGYFSFDQLSYAAIASTAAGGDFSQVEPFTQTGVSYYPSLWYTLLGLIASLFDVGVPAVWTVLGYLVIAAMIVIVGLSANAISGRNWAAALVGPALWIGPIALAVTPSWYLKLQSHAVLWGPYGTYFTLNAEAVGLALATIAFALSAVAILRVSNQGTKFTLFGIAAIVIGGLANLHTYAFLVAVAFSATWLAVSGFAYVRPSQRKWILGGTVVWIGFVTALANLVPGLRGNLVVFALMLLACVPAAWTLVIRHWRLAIPVAGLGVIAALPQLTHVATGVVQSDPFLTYRQAQSEQLGIGLPEFALASAPLAAWLITLIIMARKAPLPTPLKALSPAVVITLVMLSFNNLWGFVQEPYRMWIDVVALSAPLLVIPTATLIAKRASAPSQAVGWVAAITAGVVALSWWNIGGFRQFTQDSGVIAFKSERLSALKELTTDLDGLLASDSCIDLQELKVVSRGRVAYYNPGLAWPNDKDSIDAFLDTRNSNSISSQVLQQADIDFLITSSQCGSGSQLETSWGLVEEAQMRYPTPEGDHTFTAWRVLP